MRRKPSPRAALLMMYLSDHSHPCCSPHLNIPYKLTSGVPALALRADHGILDITGHILCQMSRYFFFPVSKPWILPCISVCVCGRYSLLLCVALSLGQDRENMNNFPEPTAPLVSSCRFFSLAAAAPQIPRVPSFVSMLGRSSVHCYVFTSPTSN